MVQAASRGGCLFVVTGKPPARRCGIKKRGCNPPKRLTGLISNDMLQNPKVGVPLCYSAASFLKRHGASSKLFLRFGGPRLGHLSTLGCRTSHATVASCRRAN